MLVLTPTDKETVHKMTHTAFSLVPLTERAGYTYGCGQDGRAGRGWLASHEVKR